MRQQAVCSELIIAFANKDTLYAKRSKHTVPNSRHLAAVRDDLVPNSSLLAAVRDDLVPNSRLLAAVRDDLVPNMTAAIGRNT